MRVALVASLVALALAGCGKAGAPPAPANLATAQTGDAANVAATTAVVAGGSQQQAGASAAPGSGAALPGPPWADAPANASTVTIQFQRGTRCWMYYGVASTFNGRFEAGQQVDITSTGQQANGNGSEGWYETVPRAPYIAGADGKLLIANQSGYFTIPATAAYQVGFGPLSMVGQPGVMIVCTL